MSKQAFMEGFITRLAGSGVSLEEADAYLEKTSDGELGKALLIGGGAAIAAPYILAAMASNKIHRAQSVEESDIEAARQEDLIRAYQQATQEIENANAKAAPAVRRAPRPGRYPDPGAAGLPAADGKAG